MKKDYRPWVKCAVCGKRKRWNRASTIQRCHKCYMKQNVGTQHCRYKGKYTESRGYVKIKKPGHPTASKAGWIFEHRLIMETHLGRLLLPSEIVHHVNGVKDDNRVANLVLCQSDREHLAYHKKNRKCTLCEKPHYGRGYCYPHYSKLIEQPQDKARSIARGVARTVQFPKIPICGICGSPAYAKGLCHPHYLKKWKRDHGMV